MRHWRNSFVTRLGVLFGLLLVLVVLASGWLRDHSSRNQFVREQRRHLENRAEIIRRHFQSTVDALCKDVLFLSHTPAVARVIAANAAGGPAAEEARRDAGVYFRALLEVRPAYIQARLIGMEDGGREIIRFDVGTDGIREVTELQRKGDRDYFLETAKLPPGRFHLSELNLNVESGRSAEPAAPTLRASIPVFRADGQRFGLVIINMDVTSLLASVMALAGPDVVVTLSNERGDYLVHPDPGKCFAFDLGRHFSLFDDLPQLEDAATRPHIQDDAVELALLDEFPLMPGGDRPLLLRLSQPKALLLAHLQAQRTQNFMATVAIALLAGGVVVLATSFLARRLRQMAGAMERYEPGAPLPVLPARRPDEIGLLTLKFQDMAAKISEQVQNLRDARQCAESATRARDEFLATMSHEIRTPMNAVLGLAHLLEEEERDPVQAERVRTLKFAGRHLMSLLNNLLDRDRIEAGEIVLDRIEFDLRDLLENLRRSLEPLAQRKGLQLNLHLGSELPRHVQGDPVRLYQVLNNLAHNAIKFTQKGEVAVSATALSPQAVQLVVRDTGPGLPPEVRARLESGAPAPPESGLGLNISRRLIELLGGKLQAKVTPNGTAFEFVLPVRALAEPRHAARQAGPPDLADCTILVVEDVATNRMVLGAMLEKTEATVEFAATAAEARAKAAAHCYDLALVDMQLPDAPGVEVAAHLAQVCPGIRLSAVTAQVSAETRAAFQAVGVEEFVPKPIEPGELYAKLRRQTEPRVEAVHALFDHDKAMVTAYLAQCIEETLGWEKELHASIETRDRQRLARLHHRMKNALNQLELWTLDRALDGLRDALEKGDGQLEGWLARALRRIAQCRTALQARLESGTAQTNVSSPEKTA